VSDSDALQRRYRRLLVWYPAEHRRAYAEEMIGVLLASAPQGRRRPGIAEALDLIRGGLRARMRADRSDGLDTGWRDTLAVGSVVIPTLLLIYFTPWLWAAAFQRSTIVVLLITALPPVLAALGYRRSAIVICLVPALFLGFLAVQFISNSTWISGQVVGLFLAYLLTALAIALSPGTARAVQVMNGKTWTAICAIGLGVVFREATVGRLYVQPGAAPVPGWWIIPLGAAAAAAALALLRTLPPPVGKRLLLLLAIPACPSVMSVVAGGYPGAPSYGLIYLPTLAILGLAAARVSRSRRPSGS